jgi:hypothetical protein
LALSFWVQVPFPAPNPRNPCDFGFFYYNNAATIQKIMVFSAVITQKYEHDKEKMLTKMLTKNAGSITPPALSFPIVLQVLKAVVYHFDLFLNHGHPLGKIVMLPNLPCQLFDLCVRDSLIDPHLLRCFVGSRDNGYHRPQNGHGPGD